VSIKDTRFDMNKDVYRNLLIDVDEIKVMKAFEDPEPTTADTIHTRNMTIFYGFGFLL